MTQFADIPEASCPVASATGIIPAMSAHEFMGLGRSRPAPASVSASRRVARLVRTMSDLGPRAHKNPILWRAPTLGAGPVMQLGGIRLDSARVQCTISAI